LIPLHYSLIWRALSAILFALGLIAFSSHLSGGFEPNKERDFSTTTVTDSHMAKRMSNKARIQQKAEEAVATDEEKGTKEKVAKKKVAKKKVAKKKVSKKTAAAGQPLKVVWKVFNSNFKEVGCFPYPEKKKAYKMAEELDKKNKSKHFVNAVKV